MRTHAEWKVDTHIFSATGPTSSATRCFISSAALLVKVMARISNGETPWSLMRWAMRWVSTRVLPDPAPATISSGPVGVGDGLVLDRVEAFEQVVRHDDPTLPVACDGPRWPIGRRPYPDTGALAAARVDRRS